MSLSPRLDLMRRVLDLKTRGAVDGAIAMLTTGLIEASEHSEWRGEVAILANDLATLYEIVGRLHLAVEYVRKGLTICPTTLVSCINLHVCLLPRDNSTRGVVRSRISPGHAIALRMSSAIPGRNYSTD